MSDSYSVQSTDNRGYGKVLEKIKPGLVRPLHFLQAPGYGAWQEAAGKKVAYFEIKNNKEIVGCGLAVKLTIPGGYYYFYCPYGPLLAKWSPETLNSVRNYFKDNFDKKLMFVRIDADNLPTKLQKPSSDAMAATSALQPRNEWVLDISKNEDELLAGMHHKARYHIRLSQKHGASARIEKCETGQLEAFYELLKTTGERDKFSILPKRNYEAALKVLGDEAYLGYVDLDNKPIAAALCVNYDGQTHYVYGSSSDEYRKLGVGYLLQWQCILEAKKLNSKLYNFGGVSGGAKGDKLTGVTQFKQRFGGYNVGHELPSDIVTSTVGYKAFSLYKKLQRS